MGTIANAKVTHYYNCYNGDFIGCLRLFAVAAYVIKMQLKKKRGSIVCYDTPFFNLSEFYQVAMIILLPE